MQDTGISTQVGQSVKSACVLTINCLKMVKIKLQWVFAILKMGCNSASSYCNRYIRNISKNVDFFFLLSCLLADFHLMRDTFQKKNRCERKKKVRTYTYLCKSKFFFPATTTKYLVVQKDSHQVDFLAWEMPAWNAH